MNVIAYHVIFGAYGSWLPNDPRGSGSTEVRAENLKPFGEATHVDTRHSVANRPHDRELRFAAKRALIRPAVIFNGHQALSIAWGFGQQILKSHYQVFACCILPTHVHLVIDRHAYEIEQVVRLLNQSATTALLEDGRHPFGQLPNGHVPSVCEQGLRKIFLFTPSDVRQRILYVEQNPIKEGKRKQIWSFVFPYDA